MQTIAVTEDYPKETYELGKGLGDFTLAMHEALKDGWQMGEDLPVAVAAAMAHLVPSIQGMEAMPEEVQTDGIGVVQGVVSGIKPAIKAITGFQVPAEPAE